MTLAENSARLRHASLCYRNKTVGAFDGGVMVMVAISSLCYTSLRAQVHSTVSEVDFLNLVEIDFREKTKYLARGIITTDYVPNVSTKVNDLIGFQ